MEITIENKVNLLLIFLNRILTNTNRENIDNLLNFKKIDRKDIISQGHVLNEMIEEFNKLFTKKEVAFYERNRSKYYIIVFLKNIVKGVNLKLLKGTKPESMTVDNRIFSRKTVCFSIVQQ